MQLAKQRVPELDFLRGIALFGILLINVQCFSTTFFLWDLWFAKFPGRADNLVFTSINLFVSQRFIGIFSLLFGLGIAIQKNKFEANSLNFKKYFFRRTVILALFGLVNILFLFWGDILFIYSILSVLLFSCMQFSNRGLLIIAFLVFAIPTLLYSIPSVAAIFEQSSIVMNKYYTAAEFINTYQSGTFFNMMKARVIDYYNSYLPDILWHRTSFTLMLIGFYIGRNNLHQLYFQHWNKLKTFLYIFAPLCLLYIAGDYSGRYLFRPEIIFVLLNNVFILASIFTYILLALLIYKNNWFSKFRFLFAQLGKLSLSNYFLQQIICALIFHNYGLGLYFKTSPTTNVFIAVGIFIFQLILSNLYLRKYSIGPLELLWRKLSYSKKQQAIPSVISTS